MTASMVSSGTTSGSSGYSSHLRSPDTLSRTNSAAATVSIATTDSSGSNSDERKYKEDKGKRRGIVREIVMCVISNFLLYNFLFL